MTKLTKLPAPSEHQEQVAVCRWLRMRRPRVVFFAVPNKSNRGKAEAARLKREGVTAGVADLIILRPGGGIALEMKKRQGGVVSPAQKVWLPLADSVPGWVATVAHGATDAIEQLEKLGI